MHVELRGSPKLSAFSATALAGFLRRDVNAVRNAITESLLNEGVETHVVESVPVKVFGIAKTIADCFRYRNKIGLSVAIEGLQEALCQRMAIPSEIPRKAEHGGVAT